MQETDPCYILLKDIPTIQSIEVNHNSGSDINASTLEECNFRKKYQSLPYQIQKFKFEPRLDEFKIFDRTYKMKIINMIVYIFNGIEIHQADHIIG